MVIVKSLPKNFKLSIGAITEVCFMLIDVRCVQLQFEDCKLCIAEYTRILLFCSI